MLTHFDATKFAILNSARSTTRNHYSSLDKYWLLAFYIKREFFHKTPLKAQQQRKASSLNQL